MANVLHKITKVYLESVDTSKYLDGNWIINPQLPFCDPKYWKITGDMVLEMTQEEKNVVDSERLLVEKKEKIDKLWRYCTDYETSFVSGSAPAGLALKTLQGDVRALAVQQWVTALWADYYVRRQSIMDGNEVSYDFSNNGPIPYDVKDIFFGS
jgi:hypothetical protein